MRLHLAPVNAQDELGVVLLDEAEQHEGESNVMRMQRGLCAQLLDGDMTSTSHLRQILQHHTLPVAVVGHPAEVRQRLLRRAGLLLNLQGKIFVD